MGRILLNTELMTLSMKLTSAHTTTAPTYSIIYSEYLSNTSIPLNTITVVGTLTSTFAEVVPVPTTGCYIAIDSITVVNNDTVSCEIQLYTNRLLFKRTITTLDTYIWLTDGIQESNTEQGGYRTIVLAGEKGDTGAAGADGADGADGTNGTNGADGEEVELQVTATHIQWKYASDVSWTNLIALADLKGDTGDTGPQGPAANFLEMQVFT